MRRLPLVLVPALLMGVLMAAPASAAPPLVVDDDGADCPNADFNSIQAAVTAGGPGTKILVCPGTYPETVTIDATKDGLELKAKKRQEARIVPTMTSLPWRAIVYIAASDVKLDGFEINGMGSPMERFGVLIREGGSAEVTRNHITQILSADDGTGIQVGTFSGGVSLGHAEIKMNLIDQYRRNGISVNEETADDRSTGLIKHNVVIGRGPVGMGDVAQNGIQFAFGASGVAQHNDVSDNEFTGMATGAGILLFAPAPGIEISHNDLWRNEIQIDLAGGTDADVHHNRMWDAADGGIRLQSTGGTFGFFVETTGARVEHNLAVGSGQDGLRLTDESSDNLIGHNRADDNGRDGVRAETDTRDNVIKHNHMHGNGEHDAHDDSAGDGTAGTANTWHKNRCETENRPGLCE